MDRLSRAELLVEVARRDEMIEQLQEELRALRLWQVEAEHRERQLAARLEEGPLMANGAGAGEKAGVGAGPPGEGQQQQGTGQFTPVHSRKIAVSAESSRDLRKRSPQWGMAKNRHTADKRQKNSQIKRKSPLFDQNSGNPTLGHPLQRVPLPVRARRN